MWGEHCVIIIQRPQQEGKTQIAVNWVREEPGRCIVVMDEGEAQRLMQTYDLHEEQVWLWTSNMPRSRGYQVAVDNLDMILNQVYGNVQIVTVTQ